jgi:hypothetical protein
MKRFVSLALAAALGLSAIAVTTVDASAQWRGGGPGWRGGPGWNGPPPGAWGRPGWGRPGWGPGWRGGYWRGGPRYYGGWGNPGAAAAAGAIIGLGVGAAIANSNNFGGYEVAPPRGVAWRSHVAYCEDRYRSYNPSTDTFTGYDGRTYRCVGSY